MTALRDLFHQESPWRPAIETAAILAENHYLGPTKRGLAYIDEAGVIVVANASSRRLPSNWLEVTRWCILDRSKNAGSRQWGRFLKALRANDRGHTTTLISYSDPSIGHSGGLYLACSWWWAPTWHRLRPPPSGNGEWTKGELQSVKDRWAFALAPDPARVALLTAQDDAILKRYPWARYKEPGGADYREFRKLLAAAS